MGDSPRTRAPAYDPCITTDTGRILIRSCRDIAACVVSNTAGIFSWILIWTSFCFPCVQMLIFLLGCLILFNGVIMALAFLFLVELSGVFDALPNASAQRCET